MSAQAARFSRRRRASRHWVALARSICHAVPSDACRASTSPRLAAFVTVRVWTPMMLAAVVVVVQSPAGLRLVLCDLSGVSRVGRHVEVMLALCPCPQVPVGSHHRLGQRPGRR